MAIDLADQYFVEKDRNTKYMWLSVICSFLLPAIHGLLFLWIPWRLRAKRPQDSLAHKRYFSFLKYLQNVNKVFKITVFGKSFYYQPSLLIIMAIHIGINAAFCIVQTKDITYETHYYIVSKRIGRVSIANLPMILLFVAKNTAVSAFSGLTADKAVFFHKWLGRFMFLSAILHMYYSLKYWLGLNFIIMVQIPPQIFGFIAFSCLGMLNVASLRFIRNFAFDFFLAQHRVFNFIMLLLVYFHNGANHAVVILGIHLLVLDRICCRVLGLLHKYKGPTKGQSEFEILDDTTVRVSIPITLHGSTEEDFKWWRCFVPRYGNWRAGQHVLLNVSKVSFFQYHPFTIASCPDSGKMVFVIKVQKGFTKRLLRKLNKMSDLLDAESTVDNEVDAAELSNSSPAASSVSSVSSVSKLTPQTEAPLKITTASVQKFQNVLSQFTGPEILKLNAQINGPFGGTFQPLTKFESVMFFSAGSGASFTLPVALDLLKTLKRRDEADDFLYRPMKSKVVIVMAMKKMANLQWYDHLWEEFLPFFDNGRAQLLLHLTQEEPAEIDQTMDSLTTSDKSEGDKSALEKVYTLTKDMRHDSFGSTSDSTSSMSTSGVSITYARPDFEGLIGAAITELNSTSYRKAFASLGCGPGGFNQEIKRSCDKYRRVKGAPDVYCYNESFD